MLLEVVLRVTGAQEEFFFQLDPQVGVTYIPSKKGWWVYPDGRQWVEINSDGYRDEEWLEAKLDGTTRIALLGDSYVAAMEVERDQRFGEILEAGLNGDRCGVDSKFEVLNFAVMGMGTAQELETLRDRVIAYSPDYVLHFFYSGNDLFNNYRPIDAEPNRLHYDLDEEGELVRLPYSVSDNEVKRWLRHHSRTFLFIRDRVKRISAVHRAAMAAGLMQVVEVAPSEGSPSLRVGGVERLTQAQFAVEPPPEIEQAWRVTSALLEATRGVAENNRASYHLVLIPTKEEIAYSRQKSKDQGATTLDRLTTSKNIARICSERELDCLDLTSSFVGATTDPAESYFPKGGHWTPLGHRIAADSILNWLQDRVCESGDSGFN